MLTLSVIVNVPPVPGSVQAYVYGLVPPTGTAVKVIRLPTHTVGLFTVTVGLAFTIGKVVAVVEQPLLSVIITV